MAVRQVIFLTLAAALAAAEAAPVLKASEKVDLELMFAVDVSESIDAQEARVQRGGYVAALRDPLVLAAIRRGKWGRTAVAYFEWSGEGRQRQVVDWSIIHDAASARRVADALARAPIGAGRWTSISGALDFARLRFGANGFDGERRVIDISGDGFNNVGRPVTAARDRAVAEGITINGLPVIHRPKNFTWPPMPFLDLYFRNCVIGGPGAFMVVSKTLKDFAAAVRRKLILEIAGTWKPPAMTPIPAATQAPPSCAHEDIRENRF